MWAAGWAGLAALLVLAGCAQGPSVGQPVAAWQHADGAPRVQRDAEGTIIGEWRALTPSPAGCGRYQLVPTREGVAAVTMVHFWNGDAFQMTSEGCVVLP